MHGLAVAIDRFRFVAQAFDSLGDLDECSECSYAQDFAMHYIANVVSLEERFPHVRLELFHAQRQTAFVGLDSEDDGFYAIAFFQHLRRMLDPFGPAQVADM